MAKDKKLASRVPIVITESKDEARIIKLGGYVIDDATIDLLEQHHEQWLVAPAVFDGYVESAQWTAMDPWTRIFSRHLETDPVIRADFI